MINKLECPICGDGGVIFPSRIHPKNRFGDGWWYCLGCNLWFTETPSKTELDAFYASSRNVGNSRNPIRWVLSRIRALHQKRYIEKITGLEDGVVSDIGGGGGALAWSFRRWYETNTIEYGDTEYQIDNTLVTASHVLEHIPNPLFFVRDIRNYTKYLFIEVPDARRCERSFRLEHLTNYSPHSLKLILLKSGYVVVDIRTLWWPTIGWVIRCIARRVE